MLKIAKKTAKKLLKHFEKEVPFQNKLSPPHVEADFSVFISKNYDSASAALNWCLKAEHDFELGTRLALMLPHLDFSDGFNLRKQILRGILVTKSAYLKSFTVTDDGMYSLVYTPVTEIGGMPHKYSTRAKTSPTRLKYFDNEEAAQAYIVGNRDLLFKDCVQLSPSQSHFIYVEPSVELFVHTVAMTPAWIHGYNLDTGAVVQLPKDVFTKLEPMSKFVHTVLDRALVRAAKKDLIEKVLDSWKQP